jgi:hypothetical protein
MMLLKVELCMFRQEGDLESYNRGNSNFQCLITI